MLTFFCFFVALYVDTTIVLDSGTFAQDCSSYAVTSDVQIVGRDPQNRPIIKSGFESTPTAIFDPFYTFANPL